MQIFDFVVRFLFIPSIFLFIITFVPEAIEDIKDWSKLLSKSKKGKTVQTTGAAVYSNSFPCSLNIFSK